MSFHVHVKIWLDEIQGGSHWLHRQPYTKCSVRYLKELYFGCKIICAELRPQPHPGFLIGLHFLEQKEIPRFPSTTLSPAWQIPLRQSAPSAYQCTCLWVKWELQCVCLAGVLCFLRRKGLYKHTALLSAEGTWLSSSSRLDPICCCLFSSLNCVFHYTKGLPSH